MANIELWEQQHFLELSGVDMFIERGKLITQVYLPEFNKNEISILATSESLEISAIKKSENKSEQGRNYYLNEGRQSYWRHLTLPKEAQPEKLRYYFKNGRLTVIMPVNDKQDSRKEAGYAKLSTKTPQAERDQAVSWRDQEFSDQWVRYRPVRRASRVR